MTRNESLKDRWVRVALGFGALLLGILSQHPAWAVVGLYPLATAFFGYCPMYQFTGITTYPARARP